MKVLLLSLEFVLPPDRGYRVRMLSQLRLLCSLPEVESVTLLSLTSAEVPEAQLRRLERELPKVRVERPVYQPIHMRRHPRFLPRLVRLRLLGRKPYLIAKCDSARMHALVRQHMSGAFDVVYLGYLGMGAYASDVRRAAPRARVVLEEHNVEWEIFDRLARSMRPPLRQVTRAEARSLRGYERRLLREVDAVIAISGADARALEALSGAHPVVVPPVLEPKPPRSETATGPHLAYVGHLAWQPNVFGLDWLCSEVWPRVRKTVPEATLTIAGSGLPLAGREPVVPPAWRRPGVRTVGFVEDLEDLYRANVGMLAPTVGGSGVRMKLLEAMVSGMPTVTTTDGAAGLDVADGREVLIADQADAFADKAVRLIQDPELREHMRRAGYAYLAAHHSTQRARTSLERALGIDA